MTSTSEYPKRLIVDPKNKEPEKWQRLFDAMYVHERAKLGLSPDLFLPECPVCVTKKKVP
jgi:hypothetical protein